MIVKTSTRAFLIKWMHDREKIVRYKEGFPRKPLLLALTKGGGTVCEIIEIIRHADGGHHKKRTGMGIAECSDEDVYCKEIGRKLSLGRALKHAGFDRNTRQIFWNVYLNRKDDRVSKAAGVQA